MKSMFGDEHSTALSFPLCNNLSEKFYGSEVKVGGRLIKDKNIRVKHSGRATGNALLFSTRKRKAAAVDKTCELKCVGDGL